MFPTPEDPSGSPDAPPGPEFIQLRPDRLLSAVELVELRRLCRALASPMGYAEDPRSRCRMEKRRRIQTIAAAALERALSLERFMVVEVVNPDGRRALFQLLSVGLLWNEVHRPISWWLAGRSLRKDSTLGSKPAEIGFDVASIRRRTLTGAWVPLRLAPELSWDAHAIRAR